MRDPVKDRYSAFRSRNYRMKGRDTQAEILTFKNAEALADACRGTMMIVDGTIVIRFQGLHDTEFLHQGDYLVRTIMPGEEYFAALSPIKFEQMYEKV